MAVKKLFLISVLVICLPSLGYLVANVDLWTFAIAFLAVILLFAATIIGPEFATWTAIFAIYINLPGIATQVYKLPYFVAGSLLGVLLLLPLANYLVLRREKLITDRILVMTFIYLIVLVVSAGFAKDIQIAYESVLEFTLEGLILYFLIINVVRNLDALKRILWVLITAGSLLGSLSLYQELTQNYQQQFGGLAARSLHKEDRQLATNQGSETQKELRLANRSQGPVDGPNRYAQIMLMLLPLAFFTFSQQLSSPTLKTISVLAALLILSGILLTYSRGAFVTLLLLFAILVFARYIRVRTVLVCLLVFVSASAAVVPGYYVRMQTLFGAEGLVSESASTQPDAVIRGRATEMLAALHVFLDHPLLGVGPGQYTPFYSQDYMANPDIAFRQIDDPRRAHCLYCELAAETGIFGISVFGAIMTFTLKELLRARRVRIRDRPDLALLATALFLALIGYLGTAVFLQLSFQRYLWLFLALSGVAIRILTAEDPYRAKL